MSRLGTRERILKKYHIGVDIGGTFTDCAIMDDIGTVVTIAKYSTDHKNPERGVLSVLSVAAENIGISRAELLGQCRFLIHGCTVATNAMVERNGVATALLTTKGHEDAIYIGKVIQKVAGLSEQEIIHQSHLDKAIPLVERENVFGLTERIDYEGNIIVPIHIDEVDRILDEVWEKGIRSVAVSFLWAFQNDSHEQVVKQRVQEKYPDLFLTLSSELCPVLGEYERSMTSLINAYVGPKAVGYLTKLQKRLESEGYNAPLLLAHCGGGLTTLEEIKERPILTLDSGPVSGVLGARYFGRLYGESNIICTDVGGTSFDVSLVFNGETALDDEPVIDKFNYLVPRIAVKSIGAGGGSIIWRDNDGLIRVGPASAGSDPGPACYGAGGTNPTITDANVLLGYINPVNFLGGTKQLDASLSMLAMKLIAEQMKMNPIDVAAGAFRIANAQMADLVRQASIERGYDPRKFALFSYGGAGPIHTSFIARELRLKRLYIPSYATVFSALGMLTGGILHTVERGIPTSLPLSITQQKQLIETFQTLKDRVTALFAREGIDPSRQKLRCSLYLKYRMQPTALLIDVAEPLDGLDNITMIKNFEERYHSIYGPNVGFGNAGYEITKCRVDGIADSALPTIPHHEITSVINADEARIGFRPAYFEDAKGFIDTPIYLGDRLRPGMQLEGPTIIERMGDTVVLPPQTHANVDGFSNLILEVRQDGEVE